LNHRDGLEGIVFDLDFFIPLDDLEIMTQLELPLILYLDGLLMEPLDHRKSIQKIQDRLKFPDHSADSKGKVVSEDDNDVQQKDEVNEHNTNWKLVKGSKGIDIFKKRLVEDDNVIEFTRGCLSISCDPIRVFGILANPVHFRHVYDNFLESSVLHEGMYILM
jgi:hypothetical protein